MRGDSKLMPVLTSFVILSQNLATPLNGGPGEAKWTAIQRGKESEWGLDWITPWLVDRAVTHTPLCNIQVTFPEDVSR